MKTISLFAAVLSLGLLSATASFASQGGVSQGISRPGADGRYYGEPRPGENCRWSFFGRGYQRICRPGYRG